MIIGSGIIAKTFANLDVPFGVVVHAAGVSNSMCVSEDEFERDRSRVFESLRQSNRIIYFSSQGCSNLSLSSPYYAHKRMLEGIILAHKGNHVVVRLPQVCSPIGNPSNLVRAIIERIRKKLPVQCYSNVERNLITDKNLILVNKYLLDHNLSGLFSFASPYCYKPLIIIKQIEAELGIKANILFEESIYEKQMTNFISSNEFAHLASSIFDASSELHLSKVVKYVASC